MASRGPVRSVGSVSFGPSSGAVLVDEVTEDSGE